MESAVARVFRLVPGLFGVGDWISAREKRWKEQK